MPPKVGNAEYQPLKEMNSLKAAAFMRSMTDKEHSHLAL